MGDRRRKQSMPERRKQSMPEAKVEIITIFIYFSIFIYFYPQIYHPRPHTPVVVTRPPVGQCLFASRERTVFKCRGAVGSRCHRALCRCVCRGWARPTLDHVRRASPKRGLTWPLFLLLTSEGKKNDVFVILC